MLFPAADPNCVAVSATDWGDNLASYSSLGPEVELAAPGGDIQEPLLGTSMIVSAWSRFDDDYVANIGTSMATPHVTGLAALLYALGVTNAQDIRACLASTSDDLGPADRDDQFGYGRINMYNAVLAANDCIGGGGGNNAPPTAAFSASCDVLLCSFDGSASVDPDGTLVAYAWTWGDGNTGIGVTTSHTYAAPGTYLVTLNVTDDGGADDSASQSVTPTAAVEIVRVSDLEGESIEGKGKRWQPRLAVAVVDRTGGPVAAADVSVSWSGDTSGSATTATDAGGIATITGARSGVPDRSRS